MNGGSSNETSMGKVAEELSLQDVVAEQRKKILRLKKVNVCLAVCAVISSALLAVSSVSDANGIWMKRRQITTEGVPLPQSVSALSCRLMVEPSVMGVIPTITTTGIPSAAGISTTKTTLTIIRIVVALIMMMLTSILSMAETAVSMSEIITAAAGV